MASPPPLDCPLPPTPAQLALSHALLSSFSRCLSGMFYQLRRYPDGRTCFPYASDAVQQLFGVSAAQIADDAGALFARIHPDDIAAVQAKLRRSGEELSPCHQEFRVRNGQGQERWLVGDAMPEAQADGNLLWHGLISDITERKHTEEMLRQNQEWLEASKNRYKELARELEILISNAPVGIMFVSDGNIIRANQVLAELCHFPDARAMIGLKTSFLYQDQEDYQAFGAQAIPRLLADEPVELEWRLRRADGASFMARVAGRALPAETYTRGAVWMIEDITEQRRTLDALRDSEQRLQKLTNSSLIGILQGAGRGRITEVNDVFA